MSFQTPEGAFGWGFPEWGRPRIEIADRVAEGGGVSQRATVDIEMGSDPAMRVRMSVACVSTDSVALIRELAFQKFKDEIRDIADHVDGLADEAQGREPEGVWATSLMELTRAPYRG